MTEEEQMRRRFAEEDRKQQKKVSLSAGIIELESFLALIIILGWIYQHGSPLDSPTTAGKIISVIIDLLLIAIAVIVVWAEVIHMKDYRKQLRDNETLTESLNKKQEYINSLKEDIAYWRAKATQNEKN